MKILFRQAFIHDTSSIHHGRRKDILIENGIIRQITAVCPDNADIEITNDDLHVSQGWVDIFSFFGQPGYEHRETLKTGSAAAVKGGFTDVFLVPNTLPTISTNAQVTYLLRQSDSLPINLHPIGTVTNAAEGKLLSEMYDMSKAGALAFSDGWKTIEHPGTLLKAMQYLVAINGILIQVPDDKSLASHGLMNEGVTSTQLGLPGKPAIAEEICLARDIELLRYTGSRLHVTGISTEASLNLVKRAKEDGLDITVSVTPYHLFFCEEDLATYDTLLKVNPPLRTRKDMLALREAFRKDEINCIASHHRPVHADQKDCEFEYAAYGMSDLEAVFAGVNTLMPTELETLIKLLTDNPRKIFGLPSYPIEEGQIANLSFFNPGLEYNFSMDDIKSRSSNNAFIGQRLKGKVLGIFTKNKLHQNEHA